MGIGLPIAGWADAIASSVVVTAAFTPDINQARSNRDPRRLLPIAAGLLLPAQREPRREAHAEPQPDIDNEQRIAVEPLARKWLKQPNAVNIEPIERRMGQAADKAQHEQPFEMHRQPSLGPLPAFRLPAVETVEQSCQYQRQQHQCRRAMRDPAAET